jgi:sulfate adenylyltransferase subunit 1 (EFTu-like GTPase family)
MRGPLAETGVRGKRQLRFLTCGSVDDGKSTLIGRLLHDTGCVTEDQRAALTKDSVRFGTAGTELDFALLTDGLEDERQQGITIDVAFRYFSTPRSVVRRRRHSGARTIHAQYGDRRIERGTCHPAG